LKTSSGTGKEGSAKPEKRVHLVVHSDKQIQQVLSPTLDRAPSKPFYSTPSRNNGKSISTKPTNPVLHYDEDYQAVLKNAWLQGTLGILNALKQIDAKPVISARQRLLARRNSKDGVVKLGTTGSIPHNMQSIQSQNVKCLSTNRVYYDGELSQKDVEIAWLQAENLILKSQQQCTTGEPNQCQHLETVNTVFKDTVSDVLKQQDLIVAWLQAENTILKSQKQFLQNNHTPHAQAYIEAAWFQAESIILRDEQLTNQNNLAKVLLDN
jgi:hypothetical protein